MKESTKKKLDSIDKSKIKVQESKDLLAKIEKALNNDKNEENQAKAEKLLDVFIAKAKAKNADIFKTEEPAKAKTPAQKKQVAQATKSKLDALMDTIANDPLFKDFNSPRRVKGGGRSDALIDSERKARESGRRVSQKGWKNQYGKSKGGRRYYEYRENRIDRKAPNYGSKPWLEDGGLIHPSDKFQEKYSVIEIKGDGSRKVHNTFPDFETAMVFASLKRNVMPTNTRIVVEDDKGTTMYRSFMRGGEMPNGGKYYVMDAKDGKIVSQGFDTEEEAKAEMYKIFEKTRNPFLVPKKMAHGGKIDESTAMVLSQNKAIAHHTEELKNALSKNPKVEPWVVGKIERASTDISDVTHYLDGRNEYAQGGYMADGGEVESEPLDINESVYFEVYDDNGKNAIIKFKNNGSKIFESLLIGNVKAGNRNYMSYLTKNDLKSYLYKDFDIVDEVDEDYVNDLLKSLYSSSKRKSADILVVKYPYPEYTETPDTFTLIKDGEQVFDYDPNTGYFDVVSRGLSYPDQIELDDFLENSRGVSEREYTPKLIDVIEVIQQNKDINEIVNQLKNKGLIKNYMMSKGGYMADGGLVEEIKMFDKYNYPTQKTKGDKVRAIFEHFKKKGYSTEEINTALGKMNYAKGGYMADGGRVKGDSLQDVRNDAKTYSRNSKQDVYVLEEKRYEFGNDDDKKIVIGFTMATQEDIDYIKEMPKNRLVVSFKILGKYSNGELKSSEQEVLFSDGGVVKWQDVNVGDNALVIAENKMGMVVKTYGRRFHLKFPDGSEKTYSAEELEFFKDEEYAKGGKTPTGDYTKRRNLKLIVIKNPNKNGSKNYLMIDKRDFLDGLHKFEEGGNLSKEYTYIKRADVNQVVYRDSNNKETIDSKPKNGFWVSKKAIVEAGMNETKAEPNKSNLNFGVTSMRKTSSGWIAKNKVSNYKGYDWEITTMKSMRGDLVSTAVGGKNERGASGYFMFTYVMYQDPNIRLITSKPSRITEKVTLEQQEKALALFEDKVNEKYAKGGKIGFEGLSNKVAKNYEGKKVAPKYRKEYGETYDKEEAKEVGDKVASKVYRQQLAKMEKGGKLPEDLGKYFIKTRKTKMVKMSDLKPLRARPTGIENAEKYMRMAYEGKMEKRKPITIYKSQGKYRVYDGNSTYAVAKANGWENIWAEVVKNPNMNTYAKRSKDIFTIAKEIRKEGEAWKDALQRAKAMK